MFRCRPLAMAVPLIVTALLYARPSHATTFLRQSLEDLTRHNDLVVLGQVLGMESHWAPDHSIIVTDVRVLPRQILKGEAGKEITLTVIGGVVGDLGTVEFGAPVFQTGFDYVLFLSRRELPGAGESLTIPDLAQGVFNVISEAGGPRMRAVSQAAEEPMVPDAGGETAAPGGTSGLFLDEMLTTIRSLAGTR